MWVQTIVCRVLFVLATFLWALWITLRIPGLHSVAVPSPTELSLWLLPEISRDHFFKVLSSVYGRMALEEGTYWFLWPPKFCRECTHKSRWRC